MQHPPARRMQHPPARRRRDAHATPHASRRRRRAICTRAHADSVDTGQARADSVTGARIILRDSSETAPRITLRTKHVGSDRRGTAPAYRHEALAAAGKDGPWTAGSLEGWQRVPLFHHRQATQSLRDARAGERSGATRGGEVPRVLPVPTPAPRGSPHGARCARRDPRALPPPVPPCCPPREAACRRASLPPHRNARRHPSS
jgi:hypothetical protein